MDEHETGPDELDEITGVEILHKFDDDEDLNALERVQLVLYLTLLPVVAIGAVFVINKIAEDNERKRIDRVVDGRYLDAWRGETIDRHEIAIAQLHSHVLHLERLAGVYGPGETGFVNPNGGAL